MELKRRDMRTILIFLCLNLFLVLPAAFSAENHVMSVFDLKWITGNWEMEKNGKEICEHWMKPSGQTMLGMSRTVIKKKTVEFEFVIIHQEKSGEIFFTVTPSGQGKTSFKLVSVSKTEAVFENPAHDFPQRIIYRLENEKTLFARVETMDKQKGFEFRMLKGK